LGGEGDEDAVAFVFGVLLSSWTTGPFICARIGFVVDPVADALLGCDFAPPLPILFLHFLSALLNADGFGRSLGSIAAGLVFAVSPPLYV
jgi:hypothetical protein